MKVPCGKLFFFVFLTSIAYSLYLFQRSLTLPNFDPWNPLTSKALPRQRWDKNAPVNILLWNGDADHWSGFGQNDDIQSPHYINHPILHQCPINCTFITDKSLFGSVDAVVFDNVAPGEDKLYQWRRDPILLPQKRPGQLWVNFGFETPDHYPLLNQKGYMTLFDLNMTYDHTKSDTNMPISLLCNWAGGSPSQILERPPQKDPSVSLIAFLSNDCAHGKSKAFIEEFMGYVHVDSYGSCLNNKQFDGSHSNHAELLRKEIELYKKYKFVIVFENVIAKDWVSEKFMAVIQAGAVPIYKGAPNIDQWVPGPHSIIKVDDFNSPKELANYIVNIDDHAYNKYFTWKFQGISPTFQEKLDNCIFNNARCRLCERVAEIQMNKPNMAHGNQVNFKRSHALRFDGSSSYVEVGDYTEFQLKDDYTVAAWIYLDTIEDRRIVDKNTAGRIDGWSVDVIKHGTRGFLRLCTSDRCINGMKPLSTGNWYHVAVEFVSSFSDLKASVKPGAYFYINGVLDYFYEFPVNEFGIKPSKTNSLPLTIGKAASGGSHFHGMIDDVSIWSTPLSADRLKLGGNEPGLVGYWAFNEGTGYTTHDSTRDGRHGTVHGNVDWVVNEEKELILEKCV